MPIHFSSLNQKSFGKLDFDVMVHAFASHSALGRLADEQVYQTDFTSRLTAAGFQTAIEVPLTATFKTFNKIYYLDLAINDEAVYELKTVAKLTDQHAGQLLNYLMLLGLERGKLINFRPSSVESRFVNVSSTLQQRRSFTVSDVAFHGQDEFRDLIIAIVREWGTGLEIALYHQAIVDQLGGRDTVIQQLPMCRDAIPIGNQRFCLADGKSAFRVTAFSKDYSAYLKQLQSLLRHSALERIHHVNIDLHKVTFSTVDRGWNR